MPSPEDSSAFVVGVISDTHNHLYPEVRELLDGVDHIIHAGDVCSPTLLTELRTIAPVTVVRGNCDEGAWTANLPVRAELELGGARILVGHIGGGVREEAAARAVAWSVAQQAGATAGDEPAAARSGSEAVEPVDVVIFGHSHQSLLEQKDGVLHLNPGAAGPRRYGRPRTMAFLRISADGAAPTADIVVVEG